MLAAPNSTVTLDAQIPKLGLTYGAGTDKTDKAGSADASGLPIWAWVVIGIGVLLLIVLGLAASRSKPAN